MDIKLDQEVSPPGAVLGVRQALPLDSFGGGRLEHVVLEVEGDRFGRGVLVALQERHGDGGPAEGISQRHLVGVDDIRLLTGVHGVSFVPGKR